MNPLSTTITVLSWLKLMMKMMIYFYNKYQVKLRPGQHIQMAPLQQVCKPLS